VVHRILAQQPVIEPLGFDCAASCWWGCRGEDHRLEYLVGRAANSAYAAVLLMRRGYYDQALSAARGLGEIANLLFLFIVDKAMIEVWKNAAAAARRRDFTALKVRIALEKRGQPVPIDEDRYRLLSSYSIHAEPDGIPQSHDEKASAKTAPTYQEAGLLLALNEIAFPVGLITRTAAVLLGMPKEGQEIFRDTSTVLVNAIGGVNLDEKRRPWFSLH
jgi:hypothetical protein